MEVAAISGILASAFFKSLFQQQNKAQREKDDYTKKLEEAKGDDVFKYLLLINVSALEGYVLQTRIQAEQSFRLSQIIAVAGFVLLAIGIVVGIVLRVFTQLSLDAAYLAAIAGILTEFISGVFFYLYNRTLQQMNTFHDRLISSQRVAMGFLANSLVTDQTKKDEGNLDLSRKLVLTDIPDETDKK